MKTSTHYVFILSIACLFLLLPPLALAISIESLENEQSFVQLWHNEKIYLVPADSKSSGSFTGDVYSYDDQRCFKIDHVSIRPKPILATAIKCTKSLTQSATLPYTQIPDFTQYKKRLMECLKTKDHPCLRGMMSKVLEISFGMEPLVDRRDLLFKRWKDADYKQMLTLLGKGTIGEGETRKFPPKPDNDGMGQRGIFTLVGGGWLLTHYVAGD